MNKAYNGGFENVLIPDTVDGTNSFQFVAPNGAKVLTVHNPTLTSSATLALQVLDPMDGDKEAEVWRAVTVAVITATIGFCTVTGLPTGVATTIPVAATGTGIFRLVASAAQTGAIGNKVIKVSWGYDG